MQHTTGGARRRRRSRTARPASTRAGGRWPTRRSPQELKYFSEHDWSGSRATRPCFGITWFAQDALGEIVYADLAVAAMRSRPAARTVSLESVKA